MAIHAAEEMSCPKCGGITGYIYQSRGRTRSHRWKVPATGKVRCRDCERAIFCAEVLFETTPSTLGKLDGHPPPISASN